MSKIVTSELAYTKLKVSDRKSIMHSENAYNVAGYPWFTTRNFSKINPRFLAEIGLQKVLYYLNWFHSVLRCYLSIAMWNRRVRLTSAYCVVVLEKSAHICDSHCILMFSRSICSQLTSIENRRRAREALIILGGSTEIQCQRTNSSSSAAFAMCKFWAFACSLLLSTISAISDCRVTGQSESAHQW